MTPVLGLEAGVAAWVLLGGTAAVILVFLVFNPWRAIRNEPPLSEEAETRLLLRQNFETIDEEMSEEERVMAGSVENDLDEPLPYWDADDDPPSQLDVGEGDE